MNYLEAINIANTFFKEQVVPRKQEAQAFYNKILALCLFACFLGYFGLIYTAFPIKKVSSVFVDFNWLTVLGLSCYLGASLYYLMTLLHDYVHAPSYYSPASNFIIGYIVPIFVPMNPSGYRWGHFQHHSNTNRFSEEFDTLPPFKAEKTLTTFWFNCLIHSFLVLAIFTVRILINPLMMFSEKTRLIYFNYISPLGKISPHVYPPRDNSKEFKKNFVGNIISLVALISFWACSGFSSLFLIMYFTSLYIASAWIAFRSLLDHACVDVKGREEVMKANVYFTSNFTNKDFWYAGFATYHLVHHINPSVPFYFCQELNDLLCAKIPEYKQLHQRRSNLPLVIKDFFAKEITESELLNLG